MNTWRLILYAIGINAMACGIIFTIAYILTAILLSLYPMIPVLIIAAICQLLILYIILTKFINLVGCVLKYSYYNKSVARIMIFMILFNIFWIVIILACIVLLIIQALKYGINDLTYILVTIYIISCFFFILYKSIKTEMSLIKKFNSFRTIMQSIPK